MVIFLSKFRKLVMESVSKRRRNKPDTKNLDDKIALGVLIWFLGAVAQADNKFVPEEEDKIREILLSCVKIARRDLPIVLAAIKQASLQRISFDKFVLQAGRNLPYGAKIYIIESLFRVACVDRNLDKNELEIIGKIADLFKLTYRDFLDIRARIEREFGLDGG